MILRRIYLLHLILLIPLLAARLSMATRCSGTERRLGRACRPARPLTSGRFQ